MSNGNKPGSEAASAAGVSRNESGGSGNSLTDDEVIQKAMTANNGDKFEARFTSSYGDELSDWYDTRQQAEVALLANLAFWTGCERTQMWRLFRRSELYRPILDQFQLYRADILDDAIELVDETYDAP